jgi:4-carboxymuconolactone decarboxylase
LDDAYVVGKTVRDEVVGTRYRPSENFDQDLAALIVKYAFGEVWSRPGIDIQTRRLLAMAMNIGCGHFAEFRLHVGFAIDAGMDRELIKELMLQSAIYCGVPAAVSAFRHAQEEYDLFDQQAQKSS